MTPKDLALKSLQNNLKTHKIQMDMFTISKEFDRLVDVYGAGGAHDLAFAMYVYTSEFSRFEQMQTDNPE